MKVFKANLQSGLLLAESGSFACVQWLVSCVFRTKKDSSRGGKMGVLRLAALTAWLFVFSSQTAPFMSHVHGNEFRTLGLEVSWSAHAQASPGTVGIVSAQLWADTTQPKSYAVVELGDRSIEVPTDILDQNFQPMGEEGAKQEARRLASRYLGQSEGFEVSIRQIPQLRLVVVSGDGVVQCWDAETGNLQWATACGPTTSPAYPAALSQSGVVVIQGEYLYHLDWIDGRQIQVKKLPSGTSNSVAIVDAPIVVSREGSGEITTINTLALVSNYRGFVNGYSLNNSIAPWTYQLIGRSVGMPVSLPDRSSTAIATDFGWLYVFSGSLNPAVQFRFESGKRFGGSLTAGQDAFYVGNIGGSFSKISIRDRGVLEWTYRLSQSITAPPLLDPLQKRIYVSTEAGELTAIDDQSGSLAWNQIVFGSSRVRGPIAICRGSVICRTYSHTLIAYDSSSGQMLGQSSPLPLADKMIVNGISDRVYLINRSGSLTCLRPIGKQLPTIFQSAIIEATDSSKELEPEEVEQLREREPTRSPDPFDTDPAADPFGGDPFGNDPF
jgi:outer membrane protein assembly factor BamB